MGVTCVSDGRSGTGDTHVGGRVVRHLRIRERRSLGWTDGRTARSRGRASGGRGRQGRGLRASPPAARSRGDPEAEQLRGAGRRRGDAALAREPCPPGRPAATAMDEPFAALERALAEPCELDAALLADIEGASGAERGRRLPGRGGVAGARALGGRGRDTCALGVPGPRPRDPRVLSPALGTGPGGPARRDVAGLLPVSPGPAPAPPAQEARSPRLSGRHPGRDAAGAPGTARRRPA